jgi:anti-sigma-K factor RskA
VTEDRFGQLLGPYVLGELTADEKRELEPHIEECPKCRSELDHIQQTHSLLRDMSALAPSAELKARVLAGIRSETTASSRSRWRFWVPLAAALLVTVVLGAGLLQAIFDDSSTGVSLTGTALAPDASGVIRGERVGENIRIELEVRDMPELREDEYYEMWYAKDGDERISCGAFRTGIEGTTTVDFTTPINARTYPEIEITREADDGDPSSSREKILEGNLGNA